MMRQIIIEIENENTFCYAMRYLSTLKYARVHRGYESSTHARSQIREYDVMFAK